MDNNEVQLPGGSFGIFGLGPPLILRPNPVKHRIGINVEVKFIIFIICKGQNLYGYLNTFMH